MSQRSAGVTKVVARGGGHGLAQTLRAARQYASEITAVVSVADDGGSSGRLRELLGIPAPGDLRRCIGALLADGLPSATPSNIVSSPVSSRATRSATY